MSAEHKLQEALQRLKAGSHIRSDGSLTMIALAVEADVSRATAYRYEHIKQELVRFASSAPVAAPQAERSAKQNSSMQSRLDSQFEELEALRDQVKVYSQALYVLWEENNELRGLVNESNNVIDLRDESLTSATSKRLSKKKSLKNP